MKNSKINIDQSPLSSSEIENMKDFASVAAGLSDLNPPKYNGNGLAAKGVLTKIAGALVVVASLGMVYLLIGGSKPFINPPIQGATEAFTHYKLSNLVDDTLVHENGSLIIVPAGALVDKKENPIEGEVDIHYREFKDKAEIFLSGIPMEYDSAGKPYTFESAGMFEIRGTKNGEEVFINKKKPIIIQMTSDFSDTDFSKYYLDEAAKKWLYEGKDKIVLDTSREEYETAFLSREVLETFNHNDPLQKAIAKSHEKLKAHTSKEPKLPTKADPKNLNLEIVVNKTELPALATYEGIKFEIIPEKNKHFKPELAQVNWDNCDVIQSKIKDEYILQFSKGKKVATIITKPVLEGANYAEAQAKFRKKHKAYRDTLKILKAEYENLCNQRNAEAASQKARQQEIWDSIEQVQLVKQQEARQRADNSAKISRIFTVNRMGIWNCDRPIKMPKQMKFLAKFENQKGTDLNISEAFLISGTRNTVYQISKRDFHKFPFKTGPNNRILAMDTRGDIHLADIKQVQEIRESDHQKMVKLQCKKIEVKDITEENFKQMVKL